MGSRAARSKAGVWSSWSSPSGGPRPGRSRLGTARCTRLPNGGYIASVKGSSPRSTQVSTEQIERELLRLPASERARLAERLIASLDEDSEVDRAWAEEVRRRDEELDSGAVQSLPLKDSLRDLRNQLEW